MHSEPAGGAQAGAEGRDLTDTARTVFLLGPPEETARVSRDLGPNGFPSREFDRFDGFMEALLGNSPWGVVVWNSLPQTVLESALEVLRHHFRARDCAVVLAGDPDSEPGAPEGVVHALVNTPVDVEQLLDVFQECSEAGVEPGGRIPRILVVDDDQNIVLLASHIVSGMGMIPLVAFDGAEAVEKTQRFRPDLILLDINMPGMDGFQVIEALKAEAGTNLIPIIVFSARKRDEDKVRALKLGADDYVTKPFSITELSARVDRLLKRTRTGVSASSTTGLPGSVSIEQVLVDRIANKAPLAVMYFDADHFKAFNDRYGFARGDSVIRQTADTILDAARDLGNADDFVGHIGGDDFVVVTTPTFAVTIAQAVIERFENIIPYYYDAEDRARGAIDTKDRKGRQTSFPLMTLSIAIVTNEAREFHHAGEVADVAAQLKSYAKSRQGSVWVKDQRADDGR
jgi:diguanylate cyclase (GGDEF)-like protein